MTCSLGSVWACTGLLHAMHCLESSNLVKKCRPSRIMTWHAAGHCRAFGCTQACQGRWDCTKWLATGAVHDADEPCNVQAAGKIDADKAAIARFQSETQSMRAEVNALRTQACCSRDETPHHTPFPGGLHACQSPQIHRHQSCTLRASCNAGSAPGRLSAIAWKVL